MTDHTPLSDIEPIGRPVEEIERDQRNRVNPPAHDTDVDPGTTDGIIAPYNTGTGTAPSGAGAATPSVPLVDEEADRDGR
ncbi:hypothetical protein [Deinococcus pimensis]|uniref:hypothetical protein n=1 Tax=Deinococcus pimensis TaxID=309888 RepID=UPI000486032A|nr:hypothetical protein [Deinococcus pimensis]